MRKNETGDEVDPVQPTFVGEFPQVVRDEQTNFLQKRVSGDSWMSGGMDSESSLAWMICGNRLFVWSFLSPAASRNCVVLDIPASATQPGDNSWLLSILNWSNSTSRGGERVIQQGKSKSAGIILLNQKTRALMYWPDIYTTSGTNPVTNTDDNFDEKKTPNKKSTRGRPTNSSTGSVIFNSLIASATSTHDVCIAIASCSDGQVWKFLFSPTIIRRERVDGILGASSQGYPRSLRWFSRSHSLVEPTRQFLMLTDHDIHCFSVNFSTDSSLSKLWSHEIIGTDGDSGVQGGLAGQKRIWLLDMEIGNQGKVITILIATFCKDRASSSSYIEYSILTMQYKSGASANERVLEKKSPVQVIIPKARVEEEDFLFSMRLKVGGKPSGSAIILSGDGTATVAHYWRNTSRLYQFDLPYDAGKVLDVSVFPSDDGDDGAWAVLTEKAGVWAIPEKAVLLGGVEPPERSLSRKGSSNEGSAQKGEIVPRRASSEAWDNGEKQRPIFSGIARRTAQDEDCEELLNLVFHEFLLSGQVSDVLDKVRGSGAFERDGETNVFSRISKSIVDTLAKHWTTTRGAEIVALSVVSSQLMDKQQKHQKFLQFLALSKCHEELCRRQAHALQIILEHGEKLAGMIKLRELQSVISERRSMRSSSYSNSESEIPGPLWELIQLVGERARRNTVLLMDRDNAEVFYSKVSDLEELFYCLDKQLEYIVSEDMQSTVQIQRASEISNACVVIARTAMQYKNEHHLWYPSSEGLSPWYCQPIVRNGIWKITSLTLHLSNEITNSDDSSVKLDFHANLIAVSEVLLEAYSGAVTAKVERGEEHKCLTDEYWARRDAVLEALYQQVLTFVDPRFQGSSEGNEEQNEEIFRKLSSDLLSVAKQHGGYQTMWKMCCDLNDSQLLKNLMHESLGPRGYSYFVFQQMHNNKQYSELMRLGEEFPEELLSFLKQHKALLWLHEVYLHQFSLASDTLHHLALSHNDSSASVTDETESFDNKIESTLSDRKRLLHLSKIAAVAGNVADKDTKLSRIEADLKILNLQEEILNLLPEEDKLSAGQHCLPPVDLIELCLKSGNADLAVHAFDIFAWTSLSFIKSNTSLLEECWRNAANMDEWDKIYESSISEGWSDEETLGFLRESVLFQASQRCYGAQVEWFDQVLLLRQENSDASVEAILMQHKNYPEAGKLMLTAVMLGSEQGGDNNTRMDDGPLPME